MPVALARSGRVLVMAAAVIVTACTAPSEPPSPDQTASAPRDDRGAEAVGPVQIEMKNVRLHLDEGLVLTVRALRGEMVSTEPGRPPVFDDMRSYVLRVFTGDVGLDMTSLTNLMNRHVFAYEGAPLKDLDVEIDKGRLVQHGKLHKGVWLPFSMTASVAATADGRLRLHTESVSALGIPATKLLDLFGLNLEDLASIEKGHGVQVTDDNVVIAPGRVLPPPEIDGRLTRAEIAGGELRQVFGMAGSQPVPALTPSDGNAPNYLYFSGSVLRFGKLTMTGADLQLIDDDPRDVFDFYPAKYNAQLVAGYSKNTPEGGLRTYMPDYDDLVARHASPVQAPR